MDRRDIAVPALALALALAGCADMLPKAESEVSSPWHSFDQARDAIERIVPGTTTRKQLADMGIDPYKMPNLKVLTYSDILLRFPLQNAPQQRIDRGLRDCLAAGKKCTGYAIDVREVKRDRIGSFWEDALRFKRVTEVTGWSFNAIILLIGDRAVYTLYGGQPALHEQEVTRNPLGPAQELGDSIKLK